jgi:hypothetical protein
MIMSIQDKFTEHPATVGETYGEHFVAAMGFSFAMLRGALCCALHAVFPFLCVDTGSRAICELHERMVTKRSRLREQHSIEIAR